MRTMKASEFKAKCLQLMDEVAASGEPIQITKHGKPVARLISSTGLEAAKVSRGLAESKAGFAKSYMRFVGDPNEEDDNSELWEALKE